MAEGVRSKEATSLLTDLLAIPPHLRPELVWPEITEADYRYLLETAMRELGTPLGFFEDDPVGLITVALGETIWATQDEIACSVRDNPRTMVPSAHSCGKSWLVARIVVWWVLTHPIGTAQAITTSDSWDHVRTQLWPHIRWIHSTYKLPGTCLQTEWQIGDKFVATGKSPASQNEAAFSGIHDPFPMIVIDEAGALPANLGRSIESIMSSGSPRMLAIGNPAFDVDASSPWFEEQCNRDTVSIIRIPAQSTPNFTEEPTPPCSVHPDMEPHPISDHLITKAWVADLEREVGVGHPYYIARVLAEFPRDVEGRTIPRSWLDASADNEDHEESDWVRLGVDVAEEGGDEFVIALAVGFKVTIAHKSAGSANANPHDLAGRVLEVITEGQRIAAELGSSRRVRVKIDATGVGWFMSGTLNGWKKEGMHNAEIVAVKVGERCEDKKAQAKFRNKKAEMWWMGRELSQPRSATEDDSTLPPTWCLPSDEKLLRQMSSPKYGYSTDGRVQIESKADMKARGVPSPDQAEAILLAFYEPRPAGQARVAPLGELRIPGAPR